MYKYYKLLIKTQYDFASIMHFLLLLPALVACTAGVPLNSTNPRIDARIVGGYTPCLIYAPYQLSVHENDGYFFCGAVIISEDWALTAAHCTRYPYSPKRVRAGSIFYNRTGSLHDIIQIIAHDDYNAATRDYDIALLKVEPKFNFGGRVSSIPLEENEVNPGTAATVTGWGLTTWPGTRSYVLRFLNVQIVRDTVCQESYAGKVTPRMICAEGYIPESGTCLYDSGGPLVADGRLLGIVSWGYETCASGRPDVYTKISAVRDWIRDNSGV